MLNKVKFDYNKKIQKLDSFNKLKLQKIHKEKELARLTEHSKKLELAIEQKLPTDISSLVMVKQEVNNIGFKLEKEQMTSNIYSHMLSSVRKEILFKEGPIEKVKSSLSVVESSAHEIKKKAEVFLNEKRNINLEEFWLQESIIRQNDLMCKDINIYMKEFKEQELKKNIMYHMKDIHFKQKEIESDKRNELKSTKKKLREIQNEEDRHKLQEELERLKKQHKQFAKIQTRCNVKDIHDIVKYYNYLLETNEQLQFQNEIIETEKNKKTQKLVLLKEELQKRSIFKQGKSNENWVKYSYTLDCLRQQHTYIDPHFNDFILEDKLAQKEHLKEKLLGLHEILSMCIMIIYRISIQLKENCHITKANVSTRLSSIGLHLEYMITTLSKSRQYHFNLESVNTDTSNNCPPSFLRILNSYTKAPVKTEESKQESDLKGRSYVLNYRKWRDRLLEAVISDFQT